MGYPNLFEFATRELGYSSGSAQRRIQSMRLLKIAPQMEEKIQDGSLSLCVASKTQGFLRKEDQLRKQNGEEKLSVQDKQEIIESMLGALTRECERKLAELSPEAALPTEKTRPLSDEKTLIQFVANAGLMEKLEQLKSLLAHQTDGTYEQLFQKLAELALKKLDPENNKDTRLLPALEVSRTRFIPAAVRRAGVGTESSSITSAHIAWEGTRVSKTSV